MSLIYIMVIILISVWLVWNLFLVYYVHKLNKKPAKSKKVRQNRKKCAQMAMFNIIVVLLIFILICGGKIYKHRMGNEQKNQSRIPPITSQTAASDISPSIVAKNVLVYNVDKNEIIYEKNSDEKISPASTTKLLNALTVLKYCSLDEIVYVGDEIYNISDDASTAYLREGDVLCIEDLLVAMLLPSGNDAAYVLAKYTGTKILNNSDIYNYTDSEAIEAFIEEMNYTATSLGTTNSFFNTPDGYDSDGQYTTAYDLLLISNACFENKTIMDIVSKPCIYSIWENGRETTYYNTNELINPESMYYYEGTLGMKTGFSNNAGACIISVVNIRGVNYICVLMNSEENFRWKDTLTIFEEIENLD